VSDGRGNEEQQPHYPQPRISQVEIKLRSHPALKNPMTDQLTHVQRNPAVVFDRALTFRMTKQTVRQPLPCDQARLGW